MRIGRLIETITFQEKTRVADGGGGGSTSWAAISTDPSPRAEVVPVKGRETTEGESVTPVQTWLVTVRYRTDITPAHRILWGTKLLNIRSAQDRERTRKWTVIEAEEGVAQ